MRRNPAADRNPFPRVGSLRRRAARAVGAGKCKQFQRGIDQLDAEGVVRVLRRRNDGELLVLAHNKWRCVPPGAHDATIRTGAWHGG